ncbi:hypothetical protein HZB94_04910 [Candidatus Falkowbacteria bacterium]|nr:hypothetical protein [Candidatus Falkowbacteria bacterium]
MENIRPINYVEILKRDWRKIIVAALITVLLALVATLVQPFLYRATVSIFVVQKSSFSIDAYSASKSEERIANKLAQIVYSSSFLERVLQSGFRVDESYFPSDEYKRRQKWAKMIETEVPAGVSRLTIKIYHQDPNQALAITNAISYLLTAEKQEFIGIEDIDLKVLDSPLVSKYPVKPNVFLNLLFGILVGLILGGIYVVVSYNPEQDKLFGFSNKKKPHLIEYSEVPENQRIQNDLQKSAVVIEDIESVPELAEAEENPEKPEEKEEDIEEQEIVAPDINERIENSAEASRSEFTEDDEEEQLVPPKIPGVDDAEKNDLNKKYPEFENEDKIVGMPEKRDA